MSINNHPSISALTNQVRRGSLILTFLQSSACAISGHTIADNKLFNEDSTGTVTQLALEDRMFVYRNKTVIFG